MASSKSSDEDSPSKRAVLILETQRSNVMKITGNAYNMDTSIFTIYNEEIKNCHV